MKNLKKHKLLLSASLLSMAVGVAGAYIHHKNNIGDAVRLSLNGFAEGTSVAYQMISDGRVLNEGEAAIQSDGNLDIAVPKTADLADSVDYRLKIDPSGNGEAEILDLLLNINEATGKITFEGNGFDAFSSMDIKNGENNNTLSADWSGSVQTDIEGILDQKIKDSPILEMAFQNYGIDSDINKMTGGKIEIFLGEDLDYDLGDIRNRYGWALNGMTTQLSGVMVQQTMIIGGFIDASVQLKTQRKIQELQARAHKDYHPSDQMCRFGTFMRSVARSESKSDLDKFALNRFLMDKYLGIEHSSAAVGPSADVMARIERYSDLHCDPRDNGGATAAICENKPDTQEARDQINKDIDYTGALAGKLTLDIDFADGFLTSVDNNVTNDEENMMAMARNLYFPAAFEAPDEAEIENSTLLPHMDSRSYAAKMNVAHSSFVNIVGMKASAPVGNPTTTTQTSPTPAPFGTNIPVQSSNYPNSQPSITSPFPLPVSGSANTRVAPSTGTPRSQNANPPPATPGSWRVLTEDSGWAYMKALLMDMGVVDENASGDVHDEIDRILGERPSYYAQMEVLTKKIYQTPDFYTNLYDKPANVERIGASIDAITLMNQRDRYESLLRQEMLTSLLVEEALDDHVEDVNTQIYEIMQKDQIR